LYQKASDLGNRTALNNLAYSYDHGEGVEQDYEKAVELYQKAVDLGDAVAMSNLAHCYEHGHGVEQDYSVATVWLKQAADINHPGAQTKLGYLYSMGLGVPQNFEEAAKWFRMAAAQGDENARDNLQALEQQGLITAQSEAATTEAAPELVDAPRVKAKIESTVAPEAGPVTPLPGQDAGEDWIRDQDPEHYTIQVIALSAPDKLHAFIANHPDWSPFAIYRQSRYQQPLWVLVQGDYPDVRSARLARDDFPEGMQQRSELWIRKFGRVQRLLE
jgi:TPR repeat protein